MQAKVFHFPRVAQDTRLRKKMRGGRKYVFAQKCDAVLIVMIIVAGEAMLGIPERRLRRVMATT